MMLLLIKNLACLVVLLSVQVRANPDDRYPDAATMFKALNDISQVLPKPGPLTLVPEEGLVIDPNPTNIVVHSYKSL
jgi:hypothetical protein